MEMRSKIPTSQCGGGYPPLQQLGKFMTRYHATECAKPCIRRAMVLLRIFRNRQLRFSGKFGIMTGIRRVEKRLFHSVSDEVYVL